MSTYSEHKEATIDNIDTAYKTISIAVVNVVKKDGEEISRSAKMRRAFVPGDISGVAEWCIECDEIHTILEIVNLMWDLDTINKYNERIDDLI